MSKKDFEKFLSNKTKASASGPDWEKEKEEWLAYLNALYKRFEEALKKYTADGKIVISYDEIEITEENVGTYKAPKMIISFGNDHIILKPIGTFLIAAKGRVDMTGRRGTVKIVLVDSRMKRLQDHIKISVTVGNELPPKKEIEIEPQEINWEWKFMTSPPTLVYQPVNEDTIYSTIMELTNG